MLYLSDINKSFVFVDLFKAGPKAPGAAASASPGAGVGAAGPKAPAAPAAPGAPKSAAPKLQSAGSGGSGSRTSPCPFGGGKDCVKNGGNGAQNHKTGGTIFQRHQEAISRGAKVAAPKTEAETAEGKLEGAEASPAVTQESANIGSIGSDKVKPPELPIQVKTSDLTEVAKRPELPIQVKTSDLTEVAKEPEIPVDLGPIETRSQMLERLRAEAVAKQEKEGYKPTLSEPEPRPEGAEAITVSPPTRTPKEVGKKQATAADVKSGLEEAVEDTDVTATAHRGLAQVARNLGEEELAAKHEFAASEKERVGAWKMPSEEELASPDVDSVRSSYSQAKEAREKGLEDLAQIHETDAKQKASKLTSAQHKQLSDDLRESGFEKEADYHQGIHDFVQSKTARTEKLRSTIDRIKQKQKAEDGAITVEPEELSEASPEDIEAPKISDRAQRIKDRLKAARPLSVTQKPITVEDSELEEVPELTKVTPAHQKRQRESQVSETRKIQEQKAKNVLAEAKAKHEETKKKAEELRDSNAKKVAEYQSNLENYEKQKEGGVKKLRKPKKPKLEKEVKVEDQPELKEPDTDSERLTHANHTSRAKKNAELIESHLVNNPNLSKEDRSRLEQAHAISAYHSSIDHVPSSSHKSELAEAEKTTRDLGIKESWESQKQRETAASEAAAAKQKDVETQAKVREQKIAEKKQAIKERLDAREQAKQEKQQAKQEKQQAKEEETQRKQQGYAPETDLDNARVQDHRSRAQRLRSNLESHINDNPEMSDEDREKARTIIASLDEHENRTDVPGSVQSKELRDLEKLAGSHGKSEHKEKKPPKVGGRPASGTSNALRYLTSKMKQGWAQGGGLAADVASESGPGRLGSRLLNYGITGAASVGHRLLSGGKAGEEEAISRYTAEMENAKKEKEKKEKEEEGADPGQNPELYLDETTEQPSVEQTETQADEAQEAINSPEASEPSNPVPASQKSANIPERPSTATPAAQKSFNLYLSSTNKASRASFDPPGLYLK